MEKLLSCRSDFQDGSGLNLHQLVSAGSIYKWGGWGDVNCPTVPPTGSGIQVQLPPSPYKATVSSVDLSPQTLRFPQKTPDFAESATGA